MDDEETTEREAIARAAGVPPELLRDLAPIDLTGPPTALVFVQPGWGERLAELAPRNPMCRCTVLPIEPESD